MLAVAPRMYNLLVEDPEQSGEEAVTFLGATSENLLEQGVCFLAVHGSFISVPGPAVRRRSSAAHGPVLESAGRRGSRAARPIVNRLVLPVTPIGEATAAC